jgi:diadenosine tetraphosphate (Ap4A) HIT family hydrolase
MDCLFCDLQIRDRQRIIKEFEHCVAVEDLFPVSLGHMLIISKIHLADWFCADQVVLLNISVALSHVKQYLQQLYNPCGYNIGVNCGAKAGQTIMHLHVHLIPRYADDTQDPRGGVRGVIPGKQKY